MPKTRRRQLKPAFVMSGRTKRITSNGSVEEFDEESRTVFGTQITESEGHPWPPSKGDKRDLGGNFFSQKRFVVSPKVLPYVELQGVPIFSNFYTFSGYKGSVFPAIPGFVTNNTPFPWPPSLHLSDDDLDERGATAVARCKPGEPYLDLATSLTELLREGLPSLLGKDVLKNKTLASLGGEYLKFQFGYQPLVSDVKDLATIARKSDIWLRQFERDAGRRVRRGYRFPIEEESGGMGTLIENTLPNLCGNHIFTLCHPFNPSRPVYQGHLGKTIHERQVQRRVWFSGSFTYFLPDGWYSSSKMERTNARYSEMLGLKPNAETLWNVAPWSWALDWFANTGDVVSNLNDFLSKHLVMHYGYVMCETFVTDTYRWEYNQSSYPGRPSIPEIVLCTHTKQRREANPFGFGVSWDGLNPFQTSIVAALGLSRKR
jgi:hypothetical protein